MAIVLAITDVTWKFMLSEIYFPIVLTVLILYIVLHLFTIFIILLAKHELFHERLNVLQKFNNWQGPPIMTSGREGIPRYPMPLYVEKIEDEDDQNLNNVYSVNDEEAPIV